MEWEDRGEKLFVCEEEWEEKWELEKLKVSKLWYESMEKEKVRKYQ